MRRSARARPLGDGARSLRHVLPDTTAIATRSERNTCAVTPCTTARAMLFSVTRRPPRIPWTMTSDTATNPARQSKGRKTGGAGEQERGWRDGGVGRARGREKTPEPQKVQQPRQRSGVGPAAPPARAAASAQIPAGEKRREQEHEHERRRGE